MTIKSSQTLVEEALKIVKTITPEEALKLSKYLQQHRSGPRVIDAAWSAEVIDFFLSRGPYQVRR